MQRAHRSTPRAGWHAPTSMRTPTRPSAQRRRWRAPTTWLSLRSNYSTPTWARLAASTLGLRRSCTRTSWPSPPPTSRGSSESSTRAIRATRGSGSRYRYMDVTWTLHGRYMTLHGRYDALLDPGAATPLAQASRAPRGATTCVCVARPRMLPAKCLACFPPSALHASRQVHTCCPMSTWRCSTYTLAPLVAATWLRGRCVAYALVAPGRRCSRPSTRSRARGSSASSTRRLSSARSPIRTSAGTTRTTASTCNRRNRHEERRVTPARDAAEPALRPRCRQA